MILEISQNSQKNTVPKAWNFIKKESLAQVYSCEFCKTSKNTLFYRTTSAAASVNQKAADRVTHKCSVKTCSKKFRNIHRKTLTGVYFLRKLQTAGWRLQATTLLKRSSGTNVFQNIFKDFSKQLFNRTPANGCFSAVGRFCKITSLEVFSN